MLRLFLALLLVEAALIVGPGLWNSLMVTPLARSLRRAPPGPALRFGQDTFAFRNDSRIHHRGKPDLYANWCFVLGRAVVQFQRFARFEPHAPRPTSAECAALVRRVTRRPVWRRPLPAHRRIVIPGFASLHELTREEEAAVKAGLGSRLWSLLHWTNWRIVFPQLRTHQPRIAAEIVEELQAGRPVQLLITDFPRIALNHSVLVFEYRTTSPDTVEFLVYDPNDPREPGVIRYDAARRRFRPAPLCGVDVPHFRAFRMYCSPVL
jgi:hypothetical protein